LIKTLLQISSLVFLLVSCKSFVPHNAELTENELTEVENNYFSDPAKDYVYRAKIEAYGNEFGGIFILKKIEDDLHRIVLTTDFGFKMLDVELSQANFKIHFIAEQLDKTLIRKTLEKDFKLLLKRSFRVYETYASERFDIYKSKHNNRFHYVMLNNKSDILEKVMEATKSKKKVSIRFISKKNTFADSIIVEHHDLDLKINLKQIKN